MFLCSFSFLMFLYFVTDQCSRGKLDGLSVRVCVCCNVSPSCWNKSKKCREKQIRTQTIIHRVITTRLHQNALFKRIRSLFNKDCLSLLSMGIPNGMNHDAESSPFFSLLIRLSNFSRGPSCILKILTRCSSCRRRRAVPSMRCSLMIGAKQLLPSTRSKNEQTSSV